MIDRAPTLIQTYFDRAPGDDRESYFDLFAADAVVEDEGREHHGIAAVRAWREEVPPVTYAVREVTSDRGTWVALTTIAGDFPGSPVDLHFGFRFDEEQRIAELRIRS